MGGYHGHWLISDPFSKPSRTLPGGTDITGNLLTADDWTRRRDAMLPNGDDQAFLERLVAETPEREVGKYAGWIAPPRVGIDNKPGDFEYVKLA